MLLLFQTAAENPVFYFNRFNDSLLSLTIGGILPSFSLLVGDESESS